MTQTTDHVLIVAIGGTIDKTYGSGAGVRDLENQTTQVPFILQQGRSVPYPVHALMAKDSLDMTDADRQTVVEFCRSTPHDRLVLTHGTDTMVQTALALRDAGLVDKTIVLTGSAQPWCLRNSDADFNVGLALGAALVASCGVYIAMNGQVFHAGSCAKNPQDGRFCAVL